MNSELLYFPISGLINALSSLLLAFFVFINGPKASLNRKFFIFSILISIWSFGYFFWQLSDDPGSALFWSRVLMAGAIFIPASSTAFALELTGYWKERRIVVYLSYIAFFIFFLFNFTGLFIQGVEQELYFKYWPKPGVFFNLFLIIWFILTIYTFYILYLGYINSTGRRREQIKYFLTGIILGYGGGSTNYFMWYGIPIAPWGNIMGTVFLSIVAYSILAHRLFDIRVIIRRTVVYSGLLIFALATYSITVFIFAQLLGPDGQVFTSRSFVTNLIAALVIALGFEPLRQWLTRVTDRYLFKGEYDPQLVMRELAKFLSDVLDLDEALEVMMRHVVKNLRLAQGATIVIRTHLKVANEPDTNRSGYDVHRIKQVGYQDPGVLTVGENDLFLKYFTQLKQLVVTEELEQATRSYVGQSTEQAILKKLHHMKTAVAIPMVIKGQVIGIILFGEKLSGDPFSNQDLTLLQTIASETAGAIEKARLYEEDQLKSEFVSIASHELLTPTAAIEGYLSMILDEKLVAIDDKAKDYLTRVYMSARRLSQLVKDLLSVSRIEGGRIVIDRQPVPVIDLINQVVNDLTILAKEKGMGLIWNPPKGQPPVAFADREKTIQVLINLVSNGIKYNRPKGTVTIGVEPTGRYLAITVTDTGVGMSAEELTHIFEKFYRTRAATEAAIQGSGLGLYISKKLVELMGGTITATSAVGKGSTFTVTLAIATAKDRRLITGDTKLMSPDQKTFVKK